MPVIPPCSHPAAATAALAAQVAPAVLALLLAAAATGAHAHEGETHDAPAVTTAPAAPRFAAGSELFELVGVLEGRQLTLYLDHAPDNRPVQGATLELELAGAKLAVQPRGDGLFEAQLPKAPRDGTHAVSATVVAGDAADLLAAQLVVHDHTEGEGAAGGHGAAARAWPWLAGGLAGVLLVGGALAGRRRAAARGERGLA